MPICTKCKSDKPANDFYKKMTECKTCIKARSKARYVKRPKGFEKLPYDERKAIYDSYHNTSTLAVCAAKHNILYQNLKNWRKKGCFDKPPLPIEGQLI